MWKYQGRDVSTDDVAGRFGFVYLITHLASGRAYVGKKSLSRRVSRPPLKGRKRRRRSVVESDWRDYWGSSEELKVDVERYGQDAFSREILCFCDSRGELTYAELREQVLRDVLHHPDKFYNSYIGCRIHRSHVRKKAPAEFTTLEKCR